MKVVIFGGRGYIGSEFISQLIHMDVELHALNSRVDHDKMYEFEPLDLIIGHIKPDVVINCAAYVGGTSIANCEDHKDQAIQSNVVFPKMLGDICQKRGIVLGHMSSGCVYDGYPLGGFREHHPRTLTFNSTCSFYTGTKALAEDLLEPVEKKYIWRIRLPFDEYNHPRNYITKLLTFDKIVNFNNSISNRKELVRACILCIRRKVPFGTYHVVNPGPIRADEIVERMKKILRVKKDFKYFDDMEEFNKIRKIPTSNTILNTEKLESVGIRMPHVYESVEWSLRNWKLLPCNVTN